MDSAGMGRVNVIMFSQSVLFSTVRDGSEDARNCLAMISRSELEGLIVLGLAELRKFENELIQEWSGRRGLREVTTSIVDLKARTRDLEALLGALDQADHSLIAA